MIPYKKACITGATSGLGLELAKQCAKMGLDLFLTGQNIKALSELKKKYPSATIFKCNLAKPKERLDLINMLKKQKCDLLINNAGFGRYGDPIKQEIKIYSEMIEVNCTAVVELCHAFAKTKKAKTICNISSIAAYLPTAGMSCYGATKAFVKSYSQALSIELEPYHINVLVSCPGRIDTHFTERAAKAKTKKKPSYRMPIDLAAKQVLYQIKTLKKTHIFSFYEKVRLALWYLSFKANIIQRKLRDYLYSNR
jgi:hypothetical protein